MIVVSNNLVVLIVIFLSTLISIVTSYNIVLTVYALKRRCVIYISVFTFKIRCKFVIDNFSSVDV